MKLLKQLKRLLKTQLPMLRKRLRLPTYSRLKLLRMQKKQKKLKKSNSVIMQRILPAVFGGGR